MNAKFPVLNCIAEEIIAQTLLQDQRMLLFGPPGVGKSTLATNLARQLFTAGRSCFCIGADPGSPGFGIPGVVSLGQWQNDHWQLIQLEAMCTLDAGRFRLPIISAVQRLIRQVTSGVMLIDSPGVSRAIAGKELLNGLVEAAEVQIILALTQTVNYPALAESLRAIGVPVFVVNAAAEATRPGKRSRARQRTRHWNKYLENSVTQEFSLDTLNLLGTPPPAEICSAWTGRQVALLHKSNTVTLGEVQQLESNRISIKLPHTISVFDSLLVRDAQRNVDGLLETAEPFATEQIEFVPPVDVLATAQASGGPRVVGRVGMVTLCLVNGVFGDPLLHLRLRHQQRSLLFDLGEGGRLSARIAHQVTDVFISHAHMDHLSGFLWLLRSRIGELPACRLYGPPGLALHIAGFIQSFLWDRVAERGPAFIINEIHEQQLHIYKIQAGKGSCNFDSKITIQNGIILQETEFQIKVVTLDHGTPVIAYAFEPSPQINIRKDRLLARQLVPGKWLGELKQQLLAENKQATITLPNNQIETVAELAKDLVLITPGKKIVYATDFGDVENNRQQVIELARNAHTFFCESTFIETDRNHAQRNGHLTTRACGEIATLSGVSRLIAFHFSQRYRDDPQRIYEEINTVCPQVVIPKSMNVFRQKFPDELPISLDD